VATPASSPPARHARHAEATSASRVGFTCTAHLQPVALSASCYGR
jgi:hypothetical protein